MSGGVETREAASGGVAPKRCRQQRNHIAVQPGPPMNPSSFNPTPAFGSSFPQQPSGFPSAGRGFSAFAPPPSSFAQPPSFAQPSNQSSNAFAQPAPSASFQPSAGFGAPSSASGGFAASQGSGFGFRPAASGGFGASGGGGFGGAAGGFAAPATAQPGPATGFAPAGGFAAAAPAGRGFSAPARGFGQAAKPASATLPQGFKPASQFVPAPAGFAPAVGGGFMPRTLGARPSKSLGARPAPPPPQDAGMDEIEVRRVAPCAQSNRKRRPGVHRRLTEVRVQQPASRPVAASKPKPGLKPSAIAPRPSVSAGLSRAQAQDTTERGKLCKVFVKFPPDTTQEDIQKHFGQFGTGELRSWGARRRGCEADGRAVVAVKMRKNLPVCVVTMSDPGEAAAIVAAPPQAHPGFTVRWFQGPQAETAPKPAPSESGLSEAPLDAQLPSPEAFKPAAAAAGAKGKPKRGFDPSAPAFTPASRLAARDEGALGALNGQVLTARQPQVLHLPQVLQRWRRQRRARRLPRGWTWTLPPRRSSSPPSPPRTRPWSGPRTRSPSRPRHSAGRARRGPS
jgi:hypothetical protein